MAGKFVLTAEIRMRAPKNLKKVAQQIRSNLGSKTTEVKVQVKGAKKTAADLARVEKAVEKAGSKASAARGKFDLLGSAIGQAVVHVARYDVARRIVTETSVDKDLQQGSRIGMIRFGSRVDLYFENYSPLIKVNQKTIAGETLLAKK